ncbi:hypothetical protein ACWJJH_03365 [Endozoicomonadaceae bacterium StTr2]
MEAADSTTSKTLRLTRPDSPVTELEQAEGPANIQATKESDEHGRSLYMTRSGRYETTPTSEHRSGFGNEVQVLDTSLCDQPPCSSVMTQGGMPQGVPQPGACLQKALKVTSEAAGDGYECALDKLALILSTGEAVQGLHFPAFQSNPKTVFQNLIGFARKMQPGHQLTLMAKPFSVTAGETTKTRLRAYFLRCEGTVKDKKFTLMLSKESARSRSTEGRCFSATSLGDLLLWLKTLLMLLPIEQIAIINPQGTSSDLIAPGEAWSDPVWLPGYMPEANTVESVETALMAAAGLGQVTPETWTEYLEPFVSSASASAQNPEDHVKEKIISKGFELITPEVESLVESSEQWPAVLVLEQGDFRFHVGPLVESWFRKQYPTMLDSPTIIDEDSLQDKVEELHRLVIQAMELIISKSPDRWKMIRLATNAQVHYVLCMLQKPEEYTSRQKNPPLKFYLNIFNERTPFQYVTTVKGLSRFLLFRLMMEQADGVLMTCYETASNSLEPTF